MVKMCQGFRRGHYDCILITTVCCNVTNATKDDQRKKPYKRSFLDVIESQVTGSPNPMYRSGTLESCLTPGQ